MLVFLLAAAHASPLQIGAVPVMELAAPDPAAEAAEDARRAAAGLPHRFAVPAAVAVTPETHGVWEALDDGRLLWRYRLSSPGARSLNFGFTDVNLPPDAVLFIHPPGEHTRENLTFDERDNKPHRELWTALLEGSEAVLELTLPPRERDALSLSLSRVNVGYRGLTAGDVSADEDALEKSGSCNINVVCSEGDEWRQEISSAAMYSLSGWYTCSGAMVNNTAGDETPYFLTADHCGVRSSNASTMVFYWNFESPSCDQRGGGPLNNSQSGATFRASYSRSDFVLVELDDLPKEAHQVAYAGWDRSGEDARSAVAIHHPNLDEKAISFENDATAISSYSSYNSPGDGTHVWVEDWDAGTTEGGSSGSPLFNQDHRVIGQLHGGGAACGNNESDWYGSLETSWNGGGSSSSRLKDWLDPGNTGATTVDTLAPWLTGLQVDGDPLTAEGDVGGPFTPAQATFTLENRGASAIDYEVVNTATWLNVTPDSGALSAGDTVTITAKVNNAADGLPAGRYDDALVFTGGDSEDSEDSEDVEIPATLFVGNPEEQLSWSLDQNPGWSVEGAWAFGKPQGMGGASGSSDPEGGATGLNVYGYNLSGDYEKRMGAEHLTAGPIDMSDLSLTTVRFQRWLGVEEGQYDSAAFAVSADGQQWTTLWENEEDVADNAWREVEYDISEVADGQATVFLRWTMGPTDQGIEFCGWNIDDVAIWGVSSGASGPGGPGGNGGGSGNSGNSGDSGAGAEDTGGCGCASGRGGGPVPLAALTGLLGLLALRRRG